MGELVDVPCNGSTNTGYLAVPASGAGPGVIVIQEWWGLVPHIEDVADRFASAGFVALAPDLYHGQKTTEPDEAGKLMMSMNIGQAAKDMGCAVDTLKAHPAVTGDKVAVVGFCMGGGLALLLGVERPADIGAIAPFYGLIPWEGADTDWSKLQAPVRGHYAAEDEYFSPDKVAALEQELKGLGKDAELQVHPGVDHAFFNDTRPEVHDPGESQKAWDDTIAFFRSAVG